MESLYCSGCGEKLEGNPVFCNRCGKSVSSLKDLGSGSNNLDVNPSFGYAVLGFFLPIVGLILYLVWKDEKPGKGRSAGRGALINIVLWVGIWMFVSCAAMMV